jgi:1-acyl-sn-glycerol-3-phosphate acyltransferase
MNTAPVIWALGWPTLGTLVKVAARLRIYGKDRVPADGGCVVASNHFSWLDPPALGAASPASSITWRRSRRTGRPVSAR